MSQKNKRKQELKTVRGYVVELPSSKQDGSDEEDEDDGEDDNWLDYSQIKNAFSDGTFVKQYKKPRYTRVSLKDLEDLKQTYSCFGRFVLLDPWWEMTLTIGPDKRVHGLTEYSVRQDERGIASQNLVPFLLSSGLRRYMRYSEKGDADQLVDELDTFVRTHWGKKLSFEDVDPILYQFTQAHPERRECIVSARRKDPIQSVVRGVRYPGLLRFLCRLFPLTFLSCLLTPPPDVLADLETAAHTQPWVFGFKAILATKFRVYGVEAGYRAFEACGLMATLPRTQKDALYIYEVLKTDAARNGHTYISLTDLRQHRHWTELRHEVEDWVPALTFLAESRVTKEERFDGGRNVFLFHNWQAEVDIAGGLREVMSRGAQAKAPAWDVDFCSADLGGLRGDSDQWMAAQKVAGSPVCIMSGKGGCGKTTVVTHVIRHVCQEAPVAEETVDDVDALLADTELQDLGADGTKPGRFQSDPAQVTPEQLSRMIHTATQTLEESQAQDRRASSSQDQRKRDQIQIDLVTDLIKYLGTTGDTALSRTANGRKILLTAPTGKAAKLLGHKAKMESCTLHRVIYSYRAFVREQKRKQMEENRKAGWDDAQNEEGDGKKTTSPAGDRGKWSGEETQGSTASADNCGNGDVEAEGVWKYARTEVLIVDECSLVSLRLFATLLNILIENTPLKKVVLLGDVRQLPSIEPGNFLGDVFSTFRDKGLSVDLRTNHRSESELIVSNATRISQRQQPMIDPGRHFHLVAIEDSRHSADPERDAAVRDLLLKRQELHSHETSQFVSFRRVDCDAINELCCQHYNHHATKEPKGASTKQRYDFCVGDKICFRKNGQVYNQGLRMRGYLKHHPEILAAFGITLKRGDKNAEKNATMDVTAAAEQILNSNEDDKRNVRQARVAELCKENHTDGPAQGDGSQPAGVSVKQEKPWGDEQTTAEWSGRSTEYQVHATDFGIKMERLSQARGDEDTSTPSAPRCQLRLGDIGAEESVVGEAGSSQGGSQPGSSQDKDDEEEQAGKLKNSLVRLCNGEVFFIMDDVREAEDGGRESRVLTLSDRDPDCPRVVCASYAALKRECRLRHAWARTIHTYQGSESDTVVYFVGESKIQNWKHVYTAVTRGRKSVIMVGKESEMRQAVWRGDRPRRSRLSRRLADMMKDLPFQELHAMMRAVNEQAKAALLHPPTASTAATTPPTPTHPSPLGSDPTTTTPKPPIIDPFSDSDDSWVRDMSPVWAADYVSSKTVNAAAAAASRTDTVGSPDLCLCLDDWDPSPVANGNPTSPARKTAGEDETDRGPTPTKKQCLQEERMVTLSTPKKSGAMSSDLVDSIVSPVRRTLNI